MRPIYVVKYMEARVKSGDDLEVRDGRALGGIIRERRRSLGITQEYLAMTVGLTQRSLSLIERGETGARFDNLLDLCLALGLDLSVRVR